MHAVNVFALQANIRSDEIINKLLAEGFTPPSSAGTSSGDQPENCAPESPRADSVGSKPGSASGKSRRRRAALHVKNDSEGVVKNEGHRKDPRPTTQQSSGPGQPKTQQVAGMSSNTPTQPRASTFHLLVHRRGLLCCRNAMVTQYQPRRYYDTVLHPGRSLSNGVI